MTSSSPQTVETTLAFIRELFEEAARRAGMPEVRHG